jgi:hypothetical protein
MRQNKNITIAYDISVESDKEAINYLKKISKDTNRSLSQTSKTLLGLGITTFNSLVKELIKVEKNPATYRGNNNETK